MITRYWTTWWISLGGYTLAFVAISTLSSAFTGSWAVVLFSALVFAVTLVWVAVNERAYRAARDQLAGRFSGFWGRFTPVVVLVVLAISALTITVQRTLASQSSATVTNVVNGFAYLAGFVWFILGGLLVIAFWIARTAQAKGRSHTAWFWLGFFFPLIAWIIVATMSPTSTVALTPVTVLNDPSEPVEEDTRVCPYCAETIRVQAIKCKHCGEFLNDPASPTS